MQTNTRGDDTAVIRLDTTRVAWREVDGEIVAVDIETAEYLTMNGSGALLWHALADGTTEDELAAFLAETYSIPADQAGPDVQVFISSLRERGLVTAGA